MRLKILFVLLIGLVGHSATALSDRVVIKNVDVMTWPESLSADEALHVYIEIINSDPEARSVLNQVNRKLIDHGIKSVREIFSYCKGAPTADGATAFFSQKVNVVETRISIPGISANPWSNSAVAAQKNGFSSKVVRTPFVEFLMVSAKPEICIYKQNRLIEGYDSVMHEMTHFLLKDPFTFFEELLSSRPLPDYVQTTVTGPGGELDAFKVGSSAAIRFLTQYNIQEYNSEAYVFFSPDGRLIDESGLKKYLIKIYSEYYQSQLFLDELKSYKLKMIKTKLNILKNYVEPAIKSRGRNDLEKSLADEIAVLEGLKSNLR